MLKPPTNIQALMIEWSEDSRVDSTEPGLELLKIPTLHSKYLNILTHHNLLSKKASVAYNKAKLLKSQYYHGDLNNKEDLEKHNLEPNPKKIMRTDIGMYIDADDDMNTLLLKKAANQEIVDYCTSVLKELHSRTFQIRSYIDYVKFTNGAG
jgi:hypothetical protein